MGTQDKKTVLKELLDLGKSKGKLSSKDIHDALDDLDFDVEQMDKLYEIRRKMGLPGKHPANVCPNAKAGKPSCHSCGGSCSAAAPEASTADADLVASITKKVMDQLGL